MKWMIITVLFGLYVGYSLVDRFDADTVRGKRVLLTGASQGIGEQMAYEYARLGASIIITARSENKLQNVIAKCKEIGNSVNPHARYDYIKADMSDMDATEKVVRFAAEKMGGIDYLVLNHILIMPLGAWEGKPDNFTLLQKTLDVNFKAYVHMTSHAMPFLEQSQGSIIVVSSIAGKIAQPYVIAYSASKFALDGFFSGLREELDMRQSKVTVTVCVIGMIGTDNAVEKLKEFGLKGLLEKVPPAQPVDAALAIIKGGAQRFREVYFPYMQAKPITLFRDWCPQAFTFVNKMLYSKS